MIRTPFQFRNRVRVINATQRLMTDYKGNRVLGILREEFGVWERRAPLSPDQVGMLIKENPGTKVLVQPCTRRIFSDAEYAAAGAQITNDVNPASLLIGVKAVPIKNLIPEKSYIFFSHTIKAQPAGMPLLDEILHRKIRLFDYECITRDGRDDTPRLVAFGTYAGYAGMVDGLQGLGLRLLSEGFSTPFLHIPNTYIHPTQAKVEESLRLAGELITKNGLPQSLAPIVVAITGNGNVARGAREVFEQLPHEYVEAHELPSLRADVLSGKRAANKLYGVRVTAKDMVRLRANPSAPFDKVHYYRHPQEYEPVFHSQVLPYVTMLANGIYWDARFPRLVTNQQLRDLRATGNKTLRVVADISCDIDGSVECLSRPTTIEKPYYTFLPEQNKTEDGLSAEGVMVLGVDNLPTELPRDASAYFGKRLLPLIPHLLNTRGSASQEDLADLPAELQRACIASHGDLMPKWRYISRLREQAQVLTNASAAKKRTSLPTGIVKLELVGHLFDTGVINRVLDLLENSHSDVNFTVVNCEVRPNTSAGAQHSRVVLQMSSTDTAKLQAVADKVRQLVVSNPKAQGEVNVLTEEAGVQISTPKRVLLFGAGRVAVPVAKFFAQQKNVMMTVATEFESHAQALIDCFPDKERGLFVPFRFPQDNAHLAEMIKQCDIVISLLPATMHVPIAEEAVRQRRHMITASYVSPEMRALHDRAADQGVVLLNEVGLDPGIDHMLIMKAVDHIHAHGGRVKELVSLCGGLPDPVAAENPLRYKISWSPRGVLNAANNSAKYLAQGQVVQVEGEKLLLSGTPSLRFPTLRLETIPNRDSLTYRELYNVRDVDSICRGTLRYEGWSNAMFALKCLGLLTAQPLGGSARVSCRDIVRMMTSDLTFAPSNIRQVLRAKGVRDLEPALEAIRFLGLSADSDPVDVAVAEACTGATPIDALCALMEKRLTFQPGEKDMVAMFHKIVGEYGDGSEEVHTSRLLAFGTPGGDSAMSATVGYTTAAAADLILHNKLADTSLKGVLIPTDKRVYEPILQTLEKCGIHWTETAERSKAK